MTRPSFCGPVRRFVPAVLAGAIALCLLAPAAGSAQDKQDSQDKKGTFIDGEYVEDYVFVPDLITPEQLKKMIDEHTPNMVIVDTSAPAVWEDEHIPGAINFPYNPNIKAPVPLPRDKTLVIYCACKDHEDSGDTARQLSLLGYRNVKVLKGGWFKWLDLKYQTESKQEKKEAK
jgi:rhodanese-related sulfurtransferase